MFAPPIAPTGNTHIKVKPHGKKWKAAFHFTNKRINKILTTEQVKEYQEREGYTVIVSYR